MAAYSFDEGEGESVADLTGNGHGGEIEGAEWFDHGRYGGALDFHGEEGECLTVPSSVDLEFTEELTFEAWARPRYPATDDPIVFKDTWGSLGSALGIGIANYGRPEGFIGEGEGESENVVGPSQIEANVWTHLAFTYDGAHMRLYENGALVATESQAEAPLAGEGPLAIGCNPDYPPEVFDGLIDEVRVYNRALGAGEVDADANAGLQAPSRAPVAAYSFDAGEGEVAEDVTGNGHTAAIEGASWSADGKYGGAMQFSSEAESMLSIPDSDDLDLTEEFTLEAWVRPESEEEWETLFAKEDTASPYYSYLIYARDHDARLAAHLDDGEEEVEITSEPAALRQRAWAHVAVTFDGAKARIYIDGQLVKACAAPPLPATDGDLQIGGNGIWGEYFDGRIDEVRIYDRALDGGEVDADMATPIQTPPVGPVAVYAFDEGEGLTVDDLTDNGHDGTIEGASWARGRFGSALEFDAAEEDVVKVPDSPDLDFSDEFTLEAWVRPSQLNNEVSPAIFKSAGEGEGSQSFAYRLYEGGAESNHPMAAIKPDPETTTYVESGEALPKHVWSHIAMTYDGASIRIFVNGEEVNEIPSCSPAITNGDLEIGAASAFGHFFDGRIDEVRIYGRALNESEVQQTMNSTFPVAVTGAAEEAEANSALMTGTASVQGEGTEYFFEYGPTTSYGNVATGEEIDGNGETAEVEEMAVDLTPETTYHYRLVAEGPLGTGYGSDQTFTTGERTMTIEEEEAEASAEGAPLTEEEAPVPLAKVSVGNFFGMMWSGDIGQMVAADDFTAIKHSGAKMMRFVVAPGADVATSFAEAKSHGLSALPYLGQGAFPKVGPARAQFLKFAKKMIEDYGPSSPYGVNTWEIWNEPNMRHPLNPGQKPLIYEDGRTQGNVKPAEFAVFYKQVVNAVRSVAPGINILAPGLFGYKSSVKGHQTPRRFMRFFNEALKAEPELKNPYEGLNLHPYVFKVRDPKKKNEVAHAPKTEADAKQVRREIKSLIQGVRGLNEGNQIWITELGFPVRSEVEHMPSHSIPAVNLQEQMLLLRATFSMLLRNRERLKIEHAIYYNIQDLPGESWEHHAGLLEESSGGQGGNPRPAWNAFASLAEGEPCTAAPC